ncbi:domain of Kin17 curved DNA-binding protein-domain-containing protein [Bombardia bombarda]|uniref:Domain of Kin17 curved DNA-binding protein-domain-containing protein n=1 Tax=Bombardia bombarda TaxID=252184 RepID=A0AA40CFQ2_9PEZI|nr:domain of Kin17 curved DNA-binding protein-domain-containing protein [Bombardia bombarda]
MPKAEFGSAKQIGAQIKARGLNRLRWYCSPCQKSCRDENGYKMHCQSESHTRKVLEVGANFKGVQEDFSKEFLHEFVSLLKTAHGEKQIHINKFYQEVIARRDHTHLNATKWHSLTEFAKYLGKNSICRVEEKDDGIFIAWINDSPEAMKRREEARRKELQDKGDEEREQMLLKEQIKRAQKEAGSRGVELEGEEDEEKHALNRQEGEKIKLSFGAKPTTTTATPITTPAPSTTPPSGLLSSSSASPNPTSELPTSTENSTLEPTVGALRSDIRTEEASKPVAPKPVSLKFGAKPQPKNVFKNAFSGAPKKVMIAQPKKMSEAERIMKEEIERKRAREAGGGPPNKRPRF